MDKENIFQRVTEAFKAFGTAAAVLVLLWLLVKGCNYLVVDDVNSYTRLTLHEFY